MSTGLETLSIVIIGRNEGERLRRCLESMSVMTAPVVYVDSGSSDGSVELARCSGVEVVELDGSTPYTAARARNAGIDRILAVHPDARYIQFVDGDCTLTDGWCERACERFEVQPEVASVIGHLRERFPNSSVYNRLCDREWRLPLGEVDACGGIAMIRVEALRQVGAFDTNIAGPEDTELCARLRMNGWKILHIDVDMAIHDAAMTRFSQWWKRNVRTGQGYAQVAEMHSRSAIRLFVRQRNSAWLWGLAFPLLVLILVWPTRGLGLGLLAAYPALGCRIYCRERRCGAMRYDACLYAISCIVGKFPQMLGQLRYCVRRLRGEQLTWVEHKGCS